MSSPKLLACTLLALVVLCAPVLAQQVPTSQQGLTCYSLSFNGVCMVGGGAGGSQSVADAAAQFVGELKYVFGQSDLSVGGSGVDCSGFVQQLYRQFAATTIPRTAAQQFQIGTPVSRDSLVPGDLVFFANTYKGGISHVGVFIGSGPYGTCTYIAAPGTGQLVKYEDLCTGDGAVTCQASTTTPCYAGARSFS